MIRKISLILALGFLAVACQKPCANNGSTQRVILKAPSFDHPLLVKQRELIEHNRDVLDSKGVQVYIEIVNPNMFAIKEMPDNSFQVHLFDKNGEKKCCYKGHVVSIATLIDSATTPAPVIVPEPVTTSEPTTKG